MSLNSDSDYFAVFRTSLGDFRVELLTEQAPVAVNNFVFLASEGFYDGLIFHRVIEKFMIQGGDPTGTGAGGPGYRFQDEIVPGLVFDQPGRLAMANAGPDTNGSQFFITTVVTPYLDGTHTIFGQVLEGQEVVDTISRVATDGRDRPREPVFIDRISILSTESARQPDPSPVEPMTLAGYAEAHAGGPGAIYVGNPGQLAGAAVTQEYSSYGSNLGDDVGNVPLYAIEQHEWINESDYYRTLFDRAKLTNPTPLTSSGNSITLQHACINRALLWCQHLEAYFIPNVLERTNGQVRIEITSFPELGLAGIDTAQYLSDGTLSMAEIYGGYIGGVYPTLLMQYLWGLWPDHETHFAVHASMAPDIDDLIANETGARVLLRNWIAGDDLYIFSDTAIQGVQDLQGLTTRSHSSQLSDWLNGMGAVAQFIAFAEVHTALERGVLDAAVTGAYPAHGQRWYEVVDFINGPLRSFGSSPIAVNGQTWNNIPDDLQQILIEEGARQELEALRLAAIQNLTGPQRNVEAGLEYVEFSPEIRRESFRVARETVVPHWLKRIGYPNQNSSTVQVFNDKVGPFVGLWVDTDGSVHVVPILRGPHAGKTMAEVLAE